MKREHFPVLKTITAQLHQLAIISAKHVVSIKIETSAHPSQPPSVRVQLTNVIPPTRSAMLRRDGYVHHAWEDDGITFVAVLSDASPFGDDALDMRSSGFEVIGRTLDHSDVVK